MGQYASQIRGLRLYKELKASEGRDDVDGEDVESLAGLICDVAKAVGPVLKRIPQTFPQYTEHDISHSRNVIDLMGQFIPQSTLEKLNALELAVLILGGLLHDVGMAVTDAEKQYDAASEDYREFRSAHINEVSAIEQARAHGQDRRASAIEDAILAEYYRRVHPERARNYIEAKLAGRLRFRDHEIADPVATLCESHDWGVRESNDRADPDKAVCRLPTNEPISGVPCNLRYLACCLRIGDVLDFDRSRTPLAVYEHIDFTSEKSWTEWNKHLQVSGWSVEDRVVMFSAKCAHPAFYVAVHQYLDLVDQELRDCRYLTDDAPPKIAKRYKLCLPHIVDRRTVQMKDKHYLAGAFRFELEYAEIMKLLMDKSLYPDPSLFLRELLQNSLDACRHAEALAKESKADYCPRIVVWDHSDDAEAPRIIFQDNGMGMSLQIVENYLMRVGRSYYRSPRFEAERQRLARQSIDLEACSRFGIGILSCFLVADRFEIETCRHDQEPLHITVEGPAKYFVIERLPKRKQPRFLPSPNNDAEDGPPDRPGTRITVHLRTDAMIDIQQTLGTLAVNIDYELRIYRARSQNPSVLVPHRWDRADPKDALREELRDLGVPDGQLGKVIVPSEIPFSRWDFSKHLHGRAWFWLLRGHDGRPCPSRGYLRIRRGLKIAGLPRFVESAWELLVGRSGYYCGDTPPAKLLSWALAKGTDPFDDLRQDHDAAEEMEISMRDLDDMCDVLKDQWDALSPHEKKAACDYFAHEEKQKRGRPWYCLPGLSRKLLRGELDWVSECPTFGAVDIGRADARLAMHGILVPGGIVHWQPQEGTTSRLALDGFTGQTQIDVRGLHAPVPAASRLFVPRDNARDLIVQFIRAVLRHAADLVHQHGNVADWRQWFETVWGLGEAEELWYAALGCDFEYILQRARWAVQRDGRTLFLTPTEVSEAWGREVPMVRGGGRKDGAIRDDPVNERLVKAWELRQKSR
ncbi:MAG: ATP-binding protein [Phycisphaerae bacterium]|nr:ATP-binding protein [Phycisphaerae bacterium]